MRTILLLFIALAFFSCDKGEIPVLKPSLSTATIQVEMGSNYGNQLFFNIFDQTVVTVNNREAWDLGFTSSSNFPILFLNSSKMMSACRTSFTSLDQVSSSTTYTAHFDAPSGNEDSTAIGDWWNHNFVYIIDRGVTTTGQNLGKIKIKFLQETTTTYTFEWSLLNESIVHFETVTKENNKLLTTFSFDTGTVAIEPPSNNWQLCFTAYSHVFHDGTPYLVTGVLSNYQQIQIATSSSNFENTNYSTALSLTFDENKNHIGYDWKVYDFDAGYYVVNPEKVFVIRTNDQRYFKLRFIDFYTASGVKGAPKFELIELLP